MVKHYLGIRDTKAFWEFLLGDEAMRTVCGFWKGVPSESTFSRAFAEFARNGLGDASLARLSKETLGDSVVMHDSRDSTAVTAREKPLLKPKNKKWVPTVLRPPQNG